MNPQKWNWAMIAATGAAFVQTVVENGFTHWAPSTTAIALLLAKSVASTIRDSGK